MRLFRSRPVDIASMRAWKFEPKPEAMIRIRHGDSSGPVILEIVAMEWGWRSDNSVHKSLELWHETKEL